MEGHRPEGQIFRNHEVRRVHKRTFSTAQEFCASMRERLPRLKSMLSSLPDMQR